MTYPRIGAAFACLGLLHDNVMERDVNPVTIGLPGGLGTSENENKICFRCNEFIDVCLVEVAT